MAKTLWPTSAPFGFITPALQALWWGISGATGHNHRGLDHDGSCPQISLIDSVSDFVYGTLPCKITTDFYTAEITFDVKYVTMGGLFVSLFFPTGVFGTIVGTTNLIRIVPNGVTMPIALTNNGAAPETIVSVLDNGVGVVGKLVAPTIAANQFIINKYGGNFSGVCGLNGVVSISYLRVI